jgi:hypothetical protein
MKGIFEDLVGHFRRNTAELPDDVVQGFLRVLETVRLQDMPCSEVFSRLDEYVEKELHGHEAARLMPLLREHLDICPDCCEEYEALLSALEQSSLNGKADVPSRGPTA